MRDPLWMEQFASEVEQLDDETAALVLDGSVEICPCCGELSAYAWQDSNAYDEFSDGIIPGGFKPESGTIAHIGTSSGLGEWECGHCKAHNVEIDSPLLAECYTHYEY